MDTRGSLCGVDRTQGQEGSVASDAPLPVSLSDGSCQNLPICEHPLCLSNSSLCLAIQALQCASEERLFNLVLMGVGQGCGVREVLFKKIIAGGTWLAQSVKPLPWAQVMISGSWD